MRWLYACALILGLSVLPAAQAAAHVLKTDGTVSGVLHIVPDDDAVAGKDVPFEFSLSGRSGICADASCEVSVQQDGQAISKQAASANDGGIATVKIRFPQAGVYDVVLAGTGFSLDYPVRVTGSSATTASQAGPLIILVSLTSLILLGIIAADVIKRRGRYENGSR